MPLRPGSTEYVTFIGKASSTPGTGTITAVVSSSIADPVPSNNTAVLSIPIAQAPPENVFVWDGRIINFGYNIGFAHATRPSAPITRARPLFSPPQTGSGAIAVDANGNVWGTSASGVPEFDHNLNLLNTFTGGGLSAGGGSIAIAIDGNNTVWIANANNTITQLSSSGAALSPATGYTGGGINAPTGIAVDSAGSVWVTNSGNNTVTHIFGGAAPTVTPISSAAASLTQGARP